MNSLKRPEVWIHFCQTAREGTFPQGQSSNEFSHLPNYNLLTTTKCMEVATWLLPPVNIISLSNNCPSTSQTKCCCAGDYKGPGTYVFVKLHLIIFTKCTNTIIFGFIFKSPFNAYATYLKHHSLPLITSNRKLQLAIKICKKSREHTICESTLFEYLAEALTELEVRLILSTLQELFHLILAWCVLSLLLLISGLWSCRFLAL